MKHARDPDRVLRRERLVEAQLVVEGGDGLRGALLAQDDRCRVAGGQVDEQEHGHADQEGDRHHECQPPPEVPEQLEAYDFQTVPKRGMVSG